MIQKIMEYTDARGREVAVPADVLAVIESAERYLLERLRAAEHLPITVKWYRFEDYGLRGWTVDVRIDYDGWSVDERLRIDDLRQTQSMREAVRDVVWKFADVMNDWLSDHLRRVREMSTSGTEGEG